jgi:hypothetical protein
VQIRYDEALLLLPVNATFCRKPESLIVYRMFVR